MIPEEIERHILNRDYIFFDYAANLWLEHIAMVKPGVAMQGHLTHVTSELLSSRELVDIEDIKPPRATLGKFEAFKDESGLQERLAYAFFVQGGMRYGQAATYGIFTSPVSS